MENILHASVLKVLFSPSLHQKPAINPDPPLQKVEKNVANISERLCMSSLLKSQQREGQPAGSKQSYRGKVKGEEGKGSLVMRDLQAHMCHLLPRPLHSGGAGAAAVGQATSHLLSFLMLFSIFVQSVRHHLASLALLANASVCCYMILTLSLKSSFGKSSSLISFS